MIDAAPPKPSRRQRVAHEIRMVLKYSAVSMAGFVTDFILLKIGLALGLQPAYARASSSLGVAMQVTFFANGFWYSGASITAAVGRAPVAEVHAEQCGRKRGQLFRIPGLGVVASAVFFAAHRGPGRRDQYRLGHQLFHHAGLSSAGAGPGSSGPGARPGRSSATSPRPSCSPALTILRNVLPRSSRAPVRRSPPWRSRWCRRRPNAGCRR